MQAKVKGEFCFRIGVSYREGVGAPRSLESAAEWFSKGAEYKSLKSLAEMGFALMRGHGMRTAPRVNARVGG